MVVLLTIPFFELDNISSIDTNTLNGMVSHHYDMLIEYIISHNDSMFTDRVILIGAPIVEICEVCEYKFF